MGHGRDVFDDPARALSLALGRARVGFPRALLEISRALLANGASQLRAFAGAVRE